jgi:agmatinase
MVRGPRWHYGPTACKTSRSTTQVTWRCTPATLRGDRFLQIGLRGYWPPPETLDWMASQQMRSFEMTEIVQRGLRDCLTEAFAIATDECDGVFLSVDIDVCVIQDTLPAPAPRSRVVCRRANCWMRCGGFASSSPSSGWMSLRSARRTTMRTSLQHWPIERSWRWDPLQPLLSERSAPIPEGTVQHHHTHLGHYQEK